MSNRISTPATFWARIKIGEQDECWPFQGARHPQGYGLLTYQGKGARAHRIAYQLTHGTITSAVHVLHSCDNPPCCNPKHLFPGDWTINNRDCVSKGRHVCRRGEEHHLAKVTEEIVDEIRKSKLTGAELGRKFGVSRVAISCIRLNKTWRKS